MQVALLGLDDPLDAAPLVDLAGHVAEHALAERREQADLGDPLQQLVRPCEHLLRARLDDAAALELDLLAEVARGVEHVVDVFQADHAVVHVRREDPLGRHPDRLDALAGRDRDEVEQRVGRVRAVQVAVHVPRRRHVLDRAVREQLARELRLGPLEQQAVLDGRVDLERVAERDLLVGHARVERELAVDELRGRHRRRRLDRVGGAQVVVLAGVDRTPK